MIVGVDIGGTKIAVGVVDEAGRVQARRECATEPERGPADGMARIRRMIRAVVEEAGGKLDGIGIGSTGPINPLDGAVGKVDTLPGWQGANLMSPLVEAFGVPVALENDADAAALGEAAWGAGRGKEHFVYVTISTGIGAGIVLNGRVYRGTAGSHPEIGHHVIDPAGRQCFCGARGCWEVLARGPAMSVWEIGRAHV
jgi:glucokinase